MTTSTRRSVVLVLGLLGVAALIVLRRGPRPAPETPPTPARVTPAADRLPARNSFVGAARCAGCHARNHERWQKDGHARALLTATPDNVLGKWTNAHHKGDVRRTASHECLDCHVTGLDLRYDRGQRTWTTSFVDAGVACESCHGAGARHAETKDPRDIVQPRKLDPELGLAVCAQCHGPRDPLFPILDQAHRYRPGERYGDRYEAHVISAPGPERSPDFFADGRPKSSSFEYQALLQSRCHRQGGATCLSCHAAPHAEHAPDGRETHGGGKGSVGDQACRGCHPAVFERIAAHSQHRAPEARSCAACHMPRTIRGALDLFADHALDVPVPENTVRHGIPNACNACHTKATPEAMAEALRARWPKAAARQARRVRLADAFGPQAGERGHASLAAVVGDAREAPTLRGAAALLLAAELPDQALPVLLPLLQDPSVVVRAKAAAALAHARARTAGPQLVALLGDDSLAVRQAAALALAALEQPEGEPALQRLAQDPETRALPQPHVRLALLAGRRSDLPAVEKHLEAALALQPYSAQALVMLADLRGLQGRWLEARDAVLEALSFDPQDPGALGRLEQLKRRGLANP